MTLAHEFKPVLRVISPRAEANQARSGIPFAAIPPRVKTQIRGRRVDGEDHRSVEVGWRRTDRIRRARVLRGVFCAGIGKITPTPKTSAARRQAS